MVEVFKQRRKWEAMCKLATTSKTKSFLRSTSLFVIRHYAELMHICESLILCFYADRIAMMVMK